MDSRFLLPLPAGLIAWGGQAGFGELVPLFLREGWGEVGSSRIITTNKNILRFVNQATKESHCSLDCSIRKKIFGKNANPLQIKKSVLSLQRFRNNKQRS